MAQLNLTRGTRASVYRAIVEALCADATLHDTIVTWLVWDDSEQDNIDIHSGNSPGIRFTPLPATQGWYSPDAFNGWLNIRVEIGITSNDADDYLNLWEALENALYPPGRRAAQLGEQQLLRDAGAETGLVEFSMPAADDSLGYNDGMWWCKGEMRISVIRTINP